MLNTRLAVISKGQVDIDAVDEAYRHRVREFLSRIWFADRDGRVHWECGEQREVIASLEGGTEYYWRKGWAIR